MYARGKDGESSKTQYLFSKVVHSFINETQVIDKPRGKERGEVQATFFDLWKKGQCIFCAHALPLLCKNNSWFEEVTCCDCIPVALVLRTVYCEQGTLRCCGRTYKLCVGEVLRGGIRIPR